MNQETPKTNDHGRGPVRPDKNSVVFWSLSALRARCRPTHSHFELRDDAPRTAAGLPGPRQCETGMVHRLESLNAFRRCAPGCDSTDHRHPLANLRRHLKSPDKRSSTGCANWPADRFTVKRAVSELRGVWPAALRAWHVVRA